MTHYSASQLNLFLRCSAAWKFRYIDGLIIPPASAMIQGTSYHKGIETNLEQKIDTHTDLKVGDVLDAASTCFDQEIIHCEEKIDKGALKDEVVGLLKVHHKEIAPTIQPVSVEEKIEIEFENVDYTLIGYIDVMTEQGLIIENKTSKQTPREVTGSYFLQGAIYALAKNKDKVRFQFGVKTKTPKIKTIDIDYKLADIEYILGLVGHVDSAIQKEAFLPNRTNFMCTKRHCGFHEVCTKEFGGRVKD